MIKLNFNIAPCGKTYYEMNYNWRYLKSRVKQILDDRNSCRERLLEILDKGE